MPGVESAFSSAINSRQNQINQTGNESRILYVGAIDIGTNSTHLLVASVNPVLNTFTVELAEKSSTRLGEIDLDSGELTEEAMLRTYETLRRFKDLASSYKLEKLVVAATSAVREAPNGRDFLSEIKENIDLEVDLISGAEEARLIYLGVLSGMPFEGKDHILVDIGGGSTELILADQHDAKALTSTRVGALRLYRDFVKHDPLSDKRIEFLKTFIQGSLEPAVDKIISRINSSDPPIIVATSGTAMALGSLIANKEDKFQTKLQGYKVAKQKLDEVVSNLLKLTPEQRKKLNPLSERRAQIIVPGALILQTAMQMLSVKELVFSERALREGLIVDWMFRHGLLKDSFSVQGNIRQRTVIHQANRFAVDRSRAERVAKHSLIIFDSTFGALHHCNEQARELLWAASMLHACGQHINLNSYHKHSWYLIRHGELLGYSQAEHLMVAAIARYHRKSLPKKKHEAWQSLNNKVDRKIVFQMSLLLRLSTSINLRAEPVIADIKFTKKDSDLIVKLVPEKLNQNLDLEEWNLLNCACLLKEATGFNLFTDT